MSACISRNGEYSSHEPGPDYNCTLCHELDEEAMRAEVDRLKAELACVISVNGMYEGAITQLTRQRDDMLKLCDEAKRPVLGRVRRACWVDADDIHSIYASKGEEGA